MSVQVFDFTAPIEGWTQKSAEAALMERTQVGVILNRYEAGRIVAIGSCKDHESAFPEGLRNRQHRVTWCYRKADGDAEDIVCLVEVPSGQVDVGQRPPTEDPYYRFMVPICAIHEDDRGTIVSYAFRNRHGFITGSKPIEIPVSATPKRRRANESAQEVRA